MTDIFEVQDEVTRRIVDALKVTLEPRRKGAPFGGWNPNWKRTTASFVDATFWYAARCGPAPC